MLKKSTYKGNYRELENILRHAALSATAENREEILEKDLKFLNESENILRDSKNLKIEDHMDSLQDIPLKNIIDYADKIRAAIVEAKVRSIINSGKNLRQVLVAEGLPVKQYQSLEKKIRNIVGKGKIRSLKQSKT